MGLPGPGRLARLAAGTALHVAATGIGLAAGTAALAGSLVAPPVRQARATAGAVAESAVYTATVLAKAGARAAGAVITGVDDATDGNLERLTEAGKAMFEPPDARRSRRVWVSRGRAHLELAAPAVEGGPSVRRALRRQLERLDGVEWAAVNDAVGRVLVTFDERRVRVDDVVEVIAAIEQARGGTQVFPLNPDHPADLEPLVAALVTVAVDTVGIGVAYAGRMLPVPRLTRHATLALAFLDSQQWIKRALVARIGTTGTDLALTGASALLHALTQSPTVPALNAAAAAARVWEMRARREVWRRREPELCRPGVEAVAGPLTPPGTRPCPLPKGPIESYRGTLGPTALASALGLLPLTFAPSRSADLLKALTPKAAVQGREAFAAVLDVRLCRRGVLPMDGSVYRRLDRVSAVVVDGATLCTGPPVVVEVDLDPAAEAAGGWDAVALWTGVSRLLGSQVDGETPGRLRLGPAGADPDRPGARIHAVRDSAGEPIGTVVVTDELDPHAEALLRAVGEAGHRLVLTAHAGTADVAGLADEVAEPQETLLETVRRVQAQGYGVLLVASGEGSVDLPGHDGAGAGAADAGPALLAADVAVAPAVPGRAPAWGADLVTGPGLADACRIVAATGAARTLSRQCVETALTGNVLGALLAAVGSAERGQRRATSPGKSATAFTMAWGAWSALRFDTRPEPDATVHTPWHALDPDQVLRRVADRGPEHRTTPTDRVARLRAAAAAVAGVPGIAGPVQYARTVAAELADPLTPLLATGAAATAVLGEATDAVLVGGAMVGSALISGFQRLRAETVLESLLLEQEVVAHREIRGGPDDGGREDVSAGALRVGDVVFVESGDVVPADARLLECCDLEVDESGLTGESQAVAKDVAATPGAVLADRTCMLHEGTSIVAGRGRAVVVAVGAATAAGRATAAAGVAAPPAGVQARLGELTRSVLPLTLAGGGAVVGLSLLWRRPLKEAVKAGVCGRRRGGARRAAAGGDGRAAGRRAPAVAPRRGRAQRAGTGGARAGRHRLLRQDRHADREPAARCPHRAPGGRRATTSCWRSPLWRAIRRTRTCTRSTGPWRRPSQATTTDPRAACRSPPVAVSPPACAAAGWSSRARPRSCSTAARTPGTPAHGWSGSPPRACGSSRSRTGRSTACPMPSPMPSPMVSPTTSLRWISMPRRMASRCAGWSRSPTVSATRRRSPSPSCARPGCACWSRPATTPRPRPRSPPRPGYRTRTGSSQGPSSSGRRTPSGSAWCGRRRCSRGCRPSRRWRSWRRYASPARRWR